MHATIQYVYTKQAPTIGMIGLQHNRGIRYPSHHAMNTINQIGVTPGSHAPESILINEIAKTLRHLTTSLLRRYHRDGVVMVSSFDQ